MSDPNSVPQKENPSLVKIIRPDVMYAVEKVFTRTKRIFLVDTESYEYIDGLIYAPDVLLTLTPPTQTQTVRRSMGFIPAPPRIVKSKPRATKADAKLYFSYPGTDYVSGYVVEKKCTYLVLRVWHDAEVERWKRISLRVTKELTALNGGVADINITVTSYTLPNDPNAPHYMTIEPKESNVTGSVSAVSPFLLTKRKVSKWLDDE